MLISKRRIKWGILLGLLVAFVALVRPVRSWFDHALVKQMNPNLSVAQLRYHADKSVVEVEQLRWRKFDNRRAFGITADKAWFAVEAAPFVDRNVIVPHVRMDDAELFLTEAVATAKVEPVIWQSELAKHIGRIDWQDLKQHFSNLLAADDVHATWSRRISQWVARSSEIQRELQSLMAASENEDNPLRYEEELRLKLRRIEELKQEHSRLLGQFSQVPELVQSECERLQTQFVAKSETLADSALSDQALANSRGLIAESLLRGIAQQAWQNIADYGAVSTLTAAHFPKRFHASYDHDVSVAEGDANYFKMEDMQASGSFVRSNNRSPFQLVAHVTVSQSDQDRVAGSWSYSFDEQNERTTLELTKSEVTEELQVDLRRGRFDNSTSPSDGLRLQESFPALEETDEDWLAVDNEPVNLQDYHLRLTGTFSDDGINGQLIIDTHYAAELGRGSQQSTAILQKAMALAGMGNSSLVIGVTGNWEQPQFVLRKEIPSWLNDAIDEELKQHLAKVNRNAESEIRIDFDSQVANLIRLVNRSTDDGRAVVVSHGQQISTARETLETILAEITGDSFARRYEKETIR